MPAGRATHVRFLRYSQGAQGRAPAERQRLPRQWIVETAALGRSSVITSFHVVEECRSILG